MRMITPLDILSIESWLLLLTLLGLARYYIHRKYQYLNNLNIPHDPPSLLTLGHMITALATETAFKWDNEQKKKHGPIWGYYNIFRPAISVHDPDMLRQIYIKEFQNFPNRQKILTKINGKELNTGLTVVQGNQWKRIRSTMTPTFSTSKLKQMTGIIEWCAGNTVEAFNRKLKNGDGTFNAREIFSRLSLDIVCSAAFSTRVDSQDDTVKEPEVSKYAKKLFSGTIFAPLIILVFLCPSIEWVFGKLGIPLYGGGAPKYFKKLTQGIIGQRKGDDPHTQGRVDLMQQMLAAEISDEDARKGPEKGMTRTEIIGNSMLMILAGYENTGNQMTFLAYNFAQYPKIQEEVQKEIDEMMEKHGRFDYEGVNSLKLLDMCINETLRLYLPVIRNFRIAKNEVTINGLTIPKNKAVSIPLYALAHDPDYWDEPYEFKPERMRDMSQIDPMMFQPFGAGPRNCIGMRFALMEIKLSMAKILHQFSFAPAENTPKPPLKLCYGVSVRSVVDYDLKVIPRKKSD